jgi:YVTN family beta-propeller protein
MSAGQVSWRQFARSARLPLSFVLFLAFVFLLAFLGGCTETLPNYPPAYREYAYVTNGKSNEVSVIDLLTLKSVKRIRVGESPTGLAANPKKNEIYVVNTESNNLSVIDAERNAVVATIGLHRSPYFVDLTPDSRRAYIANSGSANVSVVDLENRNVVGMIPVGHSPGQARVSPDGKTALAANRGDGTVSVIDTDALKVRATIRVCKTPEEIVFLADSSKAFISCSSDNEVAVVQLRRDIPQPAGSPGATATASSKAGSRKSKKSADKRTEPPPSDDAPPETADRLLTLLDVGKTPVHLALKPTAEKSSSATSDQIRSPRCSPARTRSTARTSWERRPCARWSLPITACSTSATSMETLSRSTALMTAS